MQNVRARLYALEHYRQTSTPEGVAFVIPAGDGGWQAKYVGKYTTFPTQEQAIDYIKEQIIRDIPIIIFDI